MESENIQREKEKVDDYDTGEKRTEDSNCLNFIEQCEDLSSYLSDLDSSAGEKITAAIRAVNMLATAEESKCNEIMQSFTTLKAVEDAAVAVSKLAEVEELGREQKIADDITIAVEAKSTELSRKIASTKIHNQISRNKNISSSKQTLFFKGKKTTIE